MKGAIGFNIPDRYALDFVQLLVISTVRTKVAK
jgi:hypothetical protein